MNEKITRLCQKRNLLVVFRGLARDEAFRRLLILLGSDTEEQADYMMEYSNFVDELYETGNSNLTEHILKLVLEDENVYITHAANGKTRIIPHFLIHYIDYNTYQFPQAEKHYLFV